MKRYSDEFKARMVRRLTGPHALTVKELAEEIEVSSVNLYRWCKQARGHVVKGKEIPPDKRSPEEKLRLLLEAASLPERELGEFLRRHGIHEAQLKRWREAAFAALQAKPTKSTSQQNQKIRDLERELLRKDKALAEVTALLALKKKVDMLWGDEDDDTRTSSDGRSSE